LVEQKAEWKGKIERRVSNRRAHSSLRDAARDGRGRKSRDAVKGCWRKHAE